MKSLWGISVMEIPCIDFRRNSFVALFNFFKTTSWDTGSNSSNPTLWGYFLFVDDSSDQIGEYVWLLPEGLFSSCQ